MTADGPKTPPVSTEIDPSARGDHPIAELAGCQHGVVSLDQLRGLGLSYENVDRRVAAGRLHRVYQGVYAVGHSILSPGGHRMAAVLSGGSGAVLSHRSAAALWGIRDDTRSRIDVTAPCRRGRSPRGIDAHRDGSLRPADRFVRDGIPCTTLARTLLDLAAVVPPRQLRHAIIQAEVLRLFDLTAVHEVIARSRGRRGVARLRLAISSVDLRDELANEGLERRILELCREARLPLPSVNSPLLLDGVPILPDFLWHDARLILEADSHRFHGTATAFERDRRRDRRLQVAGWTVIRCTWNQVTREPDDLLATLRPLLRREFPESTGLQAP